MKLFAPSIRLKSLIVVLFSLLSLSGLYSQNNKYRVPVIKSSRDFAFKVYIDPDTTDGGDGSYDFPFNNWSDVDIQENTAYLLKCGTVLEESISGDFINNYVGVYGFGFPPVIRGLGIDDKSDGVTVDGLQIIKAGFAWQMVALSEMDDGPSNVTIANCLIKGLDNGEGYPHRNIQGKCEGLVLYHNEICYSVNDGIYLASYAPKAIIVSNYLHHNNLGGLLETTSAGDGIQFENAKCSNSYIANNYIDRSTSNWKFALIVNGSLASESNVVCEWNTFIAPKKSSAGGTVVRWVAGKDNIYRKNLISTWSGLSGIATYNEHANQPEPYGIRDNHEYGPGRHCAYCESEDNLDFEAKEEYFSYLDSSKTEMYGSDLNVNNFWGGLYGDPEGNLMEQSRIYPNPAIGLINIYMYESANLEIISLNGSSVLKSYLYQGDNEISDPVLKHGVYILKFVSAITGDSATKKLIMH